jgi:hypothetical protein
VASKATPVSTRRRCPSRHAHGQTHLKSPVEQAQRKLPTDLDHVGLVEDVPGIERDPAQAARAQWHTVERADRDVSREVEREGIDSELESIGHSVGHSESKTDGDVVIRSGEPQP